MLEALSVAQARRIALAAQGFGRGGRERRSSWARTAGTVDTMGLLQLDSVSTVVRSHYLPSFSRIGLYDRATFDRRAFGRRHRPFFEYWAHEASLLPLALQPLLRWRMARAERLQGIYKGMAAFVRANPDYVAAVAREIEERGPLRAGDLEDPGVRSGPWWGRPKGKVALEYLFWAGRVTTAGRNGFTRIYDLTERVLPEPILAAPTPAEADAIRELVAIAGRALGIATASDMRDYFRLPLTEARQAIADLVEAGTLVPVAVKGWRQPAYLHAEARRPRRVQARALLSPFDPLVWERGRTARLFGFHYRIEIYTPAPQRRFGYYVLPFLLGDRLAARVDLKADRARETLHVLAAHGEEGIATGAVAEALAAELRLMAEWLGLEAIKIHPRGDLAPALRSVS